MNPFQLELNAALELQRRGELAQAEAAYRALLARYGPHPGVDHMLGLTLHALGRDADALPYFERAETAQPSPALWSNHAAALLAVGRAAEAADRARKAIEAEPRHFGAWLNLGLAREIERRWEEAIGALQTALSLAPQQLVALRALARCRLATGSPDAALHVIAEVTVGRDLATDVIRCQAWADLGNWAAAEALLQTLLATPATRVQALCVQAAIALAQGQRDRALASYRSAAQEDPACRDAFVRAAQIHIGRGETEAGLVLLRNWVERRPSDHAAASNYLFACNYSERFGPAALLEEHRRYRPAPLEAPAWGGDRRPHAPRLRIGWMRNEFGTDLTRIFFADVLHALTEIAPDLDHVLYAVGDPADPASASKRWAADVRDVSRLDDRRLLDTIRADEIDVLVDMIGRAAGNRLAVFAARAAPVQIGWLDAFYPSGVDAMDYLLTDRWLSPPDADEHFSERLLRLPRGRLAYSPPPAPEPGTQGATAKRLVSLNRFSKLNDAVIDAWSSILRELPDWTLLLKARGADADLTAHLHARFAARGVAPARIDVEGGGTYEQAMQAYQRSALALDPFPFSGCSSTCDALWMGLPVITWPHETIASRQSAAWLSAAGLDEWIAQDAAAYVAKAVDLARDEARRTQWRTSARERLVTSICDSRGFAADLAQALRSVAVPAGRP